MSMFLSSEYFCMHVSFLLVPVPVEYQCRSFLRLRTKMAAAVIATCAQHYQLQTEALGRAGQ
jgi:hypothetical protein